MQKIKTEDLIQTLFDRLNAATSSANETADPMARACIFNSFEQMFTDFIGHLATFRSTAAVEYARSKDFDMVTRGMNRHASSLAVSLNTLAAVLPDTLRGTQNPVTTSVQVPTPGQFNQQSRSRGNSNFMESNYGSVNQGRGVQENPFFTGLDIFDDQHYDNKASEAAGAKTSQFVSDFMESDISPKVSAFKTEAKKEIVVGQPVPTQSQPSLENPMRMSFGSHPNAESAPLSEALIDRIVAETKFGEIVPFPGHNPMAMDSITYVERGESLHEFMLYGEKQIGKLNTNTMTEDVSKHTLPRILNHRRYKEFEVFLTHGYRPVFTKQARAFYIPNWRCRGIYNSSLRSDQTTSTALEEWLC